MHCYIYASSRHTTAARGRHPCTAHPPLHACVQVSCLALSRSGRYLASGQVTYMGFTADIIIWDLEAKQLMHRMALHKVSARPARYTCCVHMPAPQPTCPAPPHIAAARWRACKASTRARLHS